MRRLWLTVGGTVLFALSAAAGPLVFTSVNSGWYRSDGVLDSKFIPGNQNYFAGEFPSQVPGQSYEFRNYFVFDLSGLSGTAVSATLSIPNIGSNVGAPFGYTLYDVTTATGVLAVANPGAGLPIFNDLGSGTTYGTVNVPTDTTNPVVLNLNGAALAAISSAGGLFAIGGDVASGGVGDHYLFTDFPTNGALPTLSVEVVPEPGTAALAVGGLGVLLAVYRRRRQA